jgi:hypothetical protein
MFLGNDISNVGQFICFDCFETIKLADSGHLSKTEI